MFPFFGDPEELHAAIEQHNAENLAVAHEMIAFIDDVVAVGTEHTDRLKTLMMIFAQRPESIHYFMAMVNASLESQHSVCRACGTVHEEELNKIIAGEREKMAAEETDIPITEIIADSVEEVIEKLHQPEMITQVNDAWGDFIHQMPDYLAAVFTEYRVNLIPGDWPKVVCECGQLYISMKDRMLRSPDITGCDGCKEKAKWG